MADSIDARSFPYPCYSRRSKVAFSLLILLAILLLATRPMIPASHRCSFGVASDPLTPRGVHSKRRTAATQDDASRRQLFRLRKPWLPNETRPDFSQARHTSSAKKASGTPLAPVPLGFLARHAGRQGPYRETTRAPFRNGPHKEPRHSLRGPPLSVIWYVSRGPCPPLSQDAKPRGQPSLEVGF